MYPTTNGSVKASTKRECRRLILKDVRIEPHIIICIYFITSFSIIATRACILRIRTTTQKHLIIHIYIYIPYINNHFFYLIYVYVIFFNVSFLLFCLFIIVSTLNARAAKIVSPNSQGILTSSCELGDDLSG